MSRFNYRTPGGDIHRLPIWAQDYIRLLKREAEYWQREAHDDHQSPTRLSVGHRDNPVYYPDDTRVTFELGEGTKVETYFSKYRESLIVRGERMLTVMSTGGANSLEVLAVPYNWPKYRPVIPAPEDSGVKLDALPSDVFDLEG